MKFSLLSISALLLSTFSGTAYAYLEPADVFTGFEVPELEEVEAAEELKNLEELQQIKKQRVPLSERKKPAAPVAPLAPVVNEEPEEEVSPEQPLPSMDAEVEPLPSMDAEVEEELPVINAIEEQPITSTDVDVEPLPSTDADVEVIEEIEEVEVVEVIEQEPIPSPQTPSVFFRAGEEIKKGIIPSVDTTKTESPFEEDPLLFDDETLEDLIPEDEEIVEDDVTEEIEEVEAIKEIEKIEEEAEEVKPAAPKKSLMSALMNRLKWLILAMVLGSLAFVFLLKKKPQAAGNTAEATTQSSAPPTPELPEPVEETSQRLEHALEAMGEKAEETNEQ